MPQILNSTHAISKQLSKKKHATKHYYHQRKQQNRDVKPKSIIQQSTELSSSQASGWMGLSRIADGIRGLNSYFVGTLALLGLPEFVQSATRSFYFKPPGQTLDTYEIDIKQERSVERFFGHIPGLLQNGECGVQSDVKMIPTEFDLIANYTFESSQIASFWRGAQQLSHEALEQCISSLLDQALERYGNDIKDSRHLGLEILAGAFVFIAFVAGMVVCINSLASCVEARRNRPQNPEAHEVVPETFDNFSAGLLLSQALGASLPSLETGLNLAPAQQSPQSNSSNNNAVPKPDNEKSNNLDERYEALADFFKAPDRYRDPITKEIMKNPYIARDTRNYEKKTLDEMTKHSSKSPFDKNVNIADKKYWIPNRELKNEIIEVLEQKEKEKIAFEKKLEKAAKRKAAKEKKAKRKAEKLKMNTNKEEMEAEGQPVITRGDEHQSSQFAGKLFKFVPKLVQPASEKDLEAQLFSHSI